MLANNSDYQNNLLNRLAYCNLPGYNKGDRIVDVLRKSKNKDYLKLADELEKAGLSHLVVKDYINENATNGFAAIAFEDPRTGDCGMTFRGTENLPEIGGDVDKLLAGDKETIKKHIDMIDNVPNTLTGDSAQVERALAFYKRNRNPDGNNYLYGHSKGGELAAEVFAKNHKEIKQVHVINAQPINSTDLTSEQKKAFRSDKFDAITIDGDFVSWLGPAPYRIRIVKNNKSKDGLFGPHDLESVQYDENGHAVIELYPYKDYCIQGVSGIVAYIVITFVQLRERIDERLVEIADQLREFLAEDLPEFLQKTYDFIVITYAKIKNKILDFCDDVETFFQNVGYAIKNFVSTYTNYGYYSAGNNPSIVVDPDKLETYAGRLKRVNTRLRSIDSRINKLYLEVSIKDLWNLLQADVMTDYSTRLNLCILYLNETAKDFRSAEKAIKNKA